MQRENSYENKLKIYSNELHYKMGEITLKSLTVCKPLVARAVDLPKWSYKEDFWAYKLLQNVVCRKICAILC